MSYETNNQKDNSKRDMLVVLKPRKRITDWEFVSGNVYRTYFPYGVVTRFLVSGASTIQSADSSLGFAEWYYDVDTKYLSFNFDPTPDANAWYVVDFEMYLSTREVYWHRECDDDTTEQVLFRGIISSPPVVSRSSADTLFGFAPVDQTQVECLNEESYFQELFYGASFKEAEAIIYHVAGDLKIDNVQKLFTGVTSSPSFLDKKIVIPVNDKTYLLTRQMNQRGSAQQWPDATQTDGTTGDPNFANSFIRSVYGTWRWVRAVDSTYKIDSPTTAHNRDWAFITKEFGKNIVVNSSLVSGSNNSFPKTDFSDIDWQHIEAAFALGATKILGSGGDILTITGVSGVAMNTTGGTTNNPNLTFLLFQQPWLIRDNNGVFNGYQLAYNTHYTEVETGPDMVGIRLKTTVDAAFGLTMITPETDFVVAHVLGVGIKPTIAGQEFGSFANPVCILYHILVDRLGLDESEIDTDAFLTAAALRSDATKWATAMATPITTNDSFPTYQDTVAKLLAAGLLRAYITSEGKFSVKAIGLMGDAELEIIDADIDEPVFNFETQEIGSISYVNGESDFAFSRAKADVLGGTNGKITERTVYQSSGQGESDASLYLHRSGNNVEIETFHWTSNLVDPYVAKIADILGERRGTMSVTVRQGAHGLELGSVVSVTRAKLPGYEYDTDELHTRKFVVIDISKEINGVTLLLDDQKGIEENAGDW